MYYIKIYFKTYFNLRCSSNKITKLQKMCVAGIKKKRSIHEQNNKLVTLIEAANEIKNDLKKIIGVNKRLPIKQIERKSA